MAVDRLDHYTIRTAHLDQTRTFYTETLGFSVGPRPPFNFPGIWLYSGDKPVVHVIANSSSPAADEYLGGRDPSIGTGTLDHVAFQATGLSEMRERLRRIGVPARERSVPGQGVQQVFLVDPNGLTIELNYPAAEAG